LVEKQITKVETPEIAAVILERKKVQLKLN
jgi:hypothetical protein